MKLNPREYFPSIDFQNLNMGGGASAKILDFLCFDIFCTFGYGGARNFLQNQKILSLSDIWVSEVGTFSVILPKIGPKWGKSAFFKTEFFE